VALVAVTGGVAAFAAANRSGHNTPVPPAHSKSAKPHPSASVRTSASAAASTASTGTANALAPSGAGNYQNVVAAAWTPADELADYNSQHPWQPGASTPEILSGSGEQGEYDFAYACMSQAGFQDTVVDAQGMQTIQYSSTAQGEFTGSTVWAMQSMYFYANAQAANTAYTQAQQDLTTCAGQNAVTASGQPVTWSGTALADVGTGFAADVNIKSSPTGGPVQVNGNYSNSAAYGDELVLAGNVLEIVNEDENLGSPLPDLHTLESGMCAYSGSCPTGTTPFTGQVTADSGTTASPGGSAIQFTVSVTNDFDSEVSEVGLVVSLGRCSCIQAPVPQPPAGTLQIWDPSTSSWQSIFYDIEGTGMDFAEMPAVPNLDLAPGQTVSYEFQLSLDASQTLTVSSGSFDVDASIHFGPSTAPYVIQLADLPISVATS
jgi:hypothetical protein